MLERGLSAAESAATEAFEEAGVRGRLWPQAVGCYYTSKGDRPCRVTLFAMEVGEMLPDWPESRHRSRRWVSLSRARLMLADPGLVDLLGGLERLLSA